MREQDRYSDEYISAYIDGELDNDDRARLLYDGQEDQELAQRINEAQILKEKVRLLYANAHGQGKIKNPFNCTAFFSNHRSLVAGITIMLVAATFILSGLIKDDELLLARQLIKNTQPIAADNIRQAIGSKEHIVINISQYQARDFDNTIDHIEQLLIQNRTNESFNIEIVANNNGLKALDTITSAHAERINQIAGKFTNLKVIACAKSLADLASEGDPVQLMKSIMITPSAAQQVAKRTSEGWLYLKI